LQRNSSYSPPSANGAARGTGDPAPTDPRRLVGDQLIEQIRLVNSVRHLDQNI
jgi:hypothetical protein